MQTWVIILGVLAAGALWTGVAVRFANKRLEQNRADAIRPFRSKAAAEVVAADRQIRWAAIGRLFWVPGEAEWVAKKAGSIGHPGEEFRRSFLAQKGKYFTLALVGGVFAGLLGILPWIMIVVALAVALFYPDLQLYNEEHYRNIEIGKKLSSSVDLLVLAVEAGMSLSAALKLVSEKEESPVGEELSRVLREVELGNSRVAALRSLHGRATEKSLRGFVSALIQAESLGIGVGPVLREQSDLLRKIRKEQAREQAQKIPVKILAPIMVCFVPAIFLMVLGPVILSFVA